MVLRYHIKNVLLLIAITVSVLILISMNRHHEKQLKSTTGPEAVPLPTVKTSSVEILNYDVARKSLDATMDRLSGYRDKVPCSRIIDQTLDGRSLRKTQLWSFDDVNFWNSFGSKPNICQVIKETFTFTTEPMSQEEFEFPLAYSLLVHSNAVQVLFLLSTVYQPQNQFCIAVDETTNDDFKRQMFLLGECFPNIFVMITPKVHWCGFSVLQGVYSCIEYLARLRDDWKYYQYLSGVDLPLKTNLEMVRIFKKLNGSFNAGIADLPDSRYNRDHSPPLPLWKSSLSATFSRESANFMNAFCPDETFWTTIAGNPNLLKMPGGFNASLWKQKLTGEWDKKYGTNETKPLLTEKKYSLFVPEKYYISRYQVWYTGNFRKFGRKCYGRFTAESCVFGVGDLKELIKRPELVGHKFYLNTQPAAFFCFYEHTRKRALKADTNFNVDAYGELPGPKLLAGTPFEEVEFRAPGGYEFY
ncbi:hypothetical protein QR680_016301 [Steinernema hermaphroditum]|uniref:Uncharacterized protein n=1 Tax=Steinernema hermaphroditum TaxID=289476 RepID=A0AA39HBV2_9BILA|nr:hypothetical protein QR680_016301 [Steinernema hermaphroditum]